MDMNTLLRLREKQLKAADAALLNNEPGWTYGNVFPIASRADMDPDELSTDKREGEISPGQKFATPGILAEMINDQIKAAQMMKGDRAMDPLGVGMAALDLSAPGVVNTMRKGPARGAILNANVWQGGPHKYGPEGAAKSLKHIGKGEGATAYGWGRYDAQARGVADDYRKAFADPDQQPLSFMDKPVDEVWNDGIVERWGDLTSKMTPDEVEDFTTVMGNLSQVNKLEDVGNVLSGFDERQMRMYRNVVEPDLVKPPTDAYLYKHDLPDEDIARYLDWDKPLSEQPEAAQAIIKAMDGKGAASSPSFMDYRGEQAYEQLVTQTGSKQAASEALRKAGIPGLKYYDGMSRRVDGSPDAKGTAYRILEAAGGDYDKAIEIAKTRISQGNMPDNPDSNLRQAINLFENRFDERTRNYVTWDQDVLDRMKLLERNGENMALPMDEASRMARGVEFSKNNVGGFDKITAVKDGQNVGEMWLKADGTVADVKVPEQFRRQGVASALYDEAGISKASDNLSYDGFRVWQKRDPSQVADSLYHYRDDLIGKRVDGGIIADVRNEYVSVKSDKGNMNFPVYRDDLVKNGLLPAKADLPDLLASMTGTPELAMLAQTMRGGEPDLSAEPAPVNLSGSGMGWNRQFNDRKRYQEIEARAAQRRQGLEELRRRNMAQGLLGGMI